MAISDRRFRLPRHTLQGDIRAASRLDPGSLPYQNNFELLSDRETYPLVRPRRFPKSHDALVRLQSVSLDPEKSDAETSAWWLNI